MRPSVDVGRKRALNVAATGLLVALVAPFAVFAVPQLAGAQHSYVVLSDSMSPTMSAGDAVVVEEVPPSAVETGDVITFERADGADGDAGTDKVTHRVVEVVQRDDGRYFRTKGDANEQPDDELVPASAVVGVVTLTIPYVGYVVDFANSDVGLLTLVVLPAVLLVVNEAWTLWVAARDGGG